MFILHIFRKLPVAVELFAPDLALIKRLLFLCGLFLIPFAPAVSQDADLDSGSKQFVACQACHGEHAEGNPLMNAPRLGGQYDWYLLRQLQNFRSDLRGAHQDDRYGPLMSSMAKTLADEQALRDVAGYIATLTPPPARTEASVPDSPGDPVEGEKTFFYCQSCHGEDAEGKPEPGAPRLADQYDWYLIQQLQNFRADIRGADESDPHGQSMRRIAKMMLVDEQAIRDVVAYISTL